METFFFCVVLLAIGIPQSICQSLRNFANLDERDITISGFSSGGTFAQQLQFSHPTEFAGIAVFSHTYYRCGPPTGIQEDYDRVCTKLFNATESQLYNIERVHDTIKEDEKNNLIGKTSHLKDKKLYVFAGLRNFLFTPAMSLNILRVYEKYIKNPQAIRTRVMDAALVMPTQNSHAPDCTAAPDLENGGSDFNANCGFSGAYEALNFLLGHRVNNRPKSGQRIALQPLEEFDQQEFTTGIEKHHMDTKGYYYVPKGCKGRPICLLHFFFHGCLNGREFVKDRFIRGSGYLEVAELNNIVMVFPQAAKSAGKENDIGCWDTFGIGGPEFATKKGAQVRAVMKMIDKVTGHSHSSTQHSHPTNYPSTTNGWGKGQG